MTTVEIVRAVRLADRTHRDCSPAQRAIERVRMVGRCVSAAESVTHPLAWLLATGRASAEIAHAVATLEPRALARLVVHLHRAHDGAAVATIATAWLCSLTQEMSS